MWLIYSSFPDSLLVSCVIKLVESPTSTFLLKVQCGGIFLLAVHILLAVAANAAKMFSKHSIELHQEFFSQRLSSNIPPFPHSSVLSFHQLFNGKLEISP
jgi:hypothetical protein